MGGETKTCDYSIDSYGVESIHRPAHPIQFNRLSGSKKMQRQGDRGGEPLDAQESLRSAGFFSPPMTITPSETLYKVKQFELWRAHRAGKFD